MSDEPIDKTNHEPADEIRLAFEHLGGKFVGRIVPVNKEIDFSSVPGIRCVLPPPKRAETKPAESAEKEIDISAIGGKVVRKASDHPLAETDAPEESVEKEDEARE
jgi:hypothetical protein